MPPREIQIALMWKTRIWKNEGNVAAAAKKTIQITSHEQLKLRCWGVGWGQCSAVQSSKSLCVPTNTREHLILLKSY